MLKCRFKPSKIHRVMFKGALNYVYKLKCIDGNSNLFNVLAWGISASFLHHVTNAKKSQFIMFTNLIEKNKNLFIFGKNSHVL